MSESERVPSPAPVDPGVSNAASTIGPRRLRAIALGFVALVIAAFAIAVVLVVT